MLRRFMRAASAMSIACALLIGLSVSACADDSAEIPQEGSVETEYVQEQENVQETAAEKAPYPDVRVYFDGLLSDRAYMIDSTVYASFNALCMMDGIEPAISYDGSVLSVSAAGLTIEAQSAAQYMVANGRYLYLPEGFYFIKDELYLPLSALSRIFCTSAVFDPNEMRIDINTSAMSLIVGGETYYQDNFTFEEVFWLPQIISAEAKNQPLAGQIGVGNVVMNRVKSEHYPNNIYDVIFDTVGGVQFNPIINGMIYNDPSPESVAAAYMCLEGYNTVGEAMFFVNPWLADDGWFRWSRTFVVSIGAHNFYM